MMMSETESKKFKNTRFVLGWLVVGQRTNFYETIFWNTFKVFWTLRRLKRQGSMTWPKSCTTSHAKKQKRKAGWRACVPHEIDHVLNTPWIPLRRFGVRQGRINCVPSMIAQTSAWTMQPQAWKEFFCVPFRLASWKRKPSWKLAKSRSEDRQVLKLRVSSVVQPVENWVETQRRLMWTQPGRKLWACYRSLRILGWSDCGLWL